MLIEPPDSARLPKWAQTLVNAANSRNRARGSDEVFSVADLAAVWGKCGGRCALSGLPFNFQVCGNGQAKRPYAPSLDRVDRHQPYRRDNVRLVTTVANFAMNAWGEDPVLQMATALHQKYGNRSSPFKHAPSDSDLDSVAVIDTDLVETSAGTLSFPPRSDLCQAILKLLRGDPQSSRKLEYSLTERFKISAEMRSAMLRSGCPAWRNHVAWALVELSKRHQGTDQIQRLETKHAPLGGTIGIYRLKHGSSPSGHSGSS